MFVFYFEANQLFEELAHSLAIGLGRKLSRILDVLELLVKEILAKLIDAKEDLHY